MVGRALGGRDPVRELVPLPPLLVPPPLHVSCREESWPGMEMDLAVDGGLGKTDGCDRSAPLWGRRRQGNPRAWRRGQSLVPPPRVQDRAPTPPAPCTSTHVLKQGSPESRNIPMVTCAKAGGISHAPSTPPPRRPASLWPPSLLWLQMHLDSDPISVPCWPWQSHQTSVKRSFLVQRTKLILTPTSWNSGEDAGHLARDE